MNKIEIYHLMIGYLLVFCSKICLCTYFVCRIFDVKKSFSLAFEGWRRSPVYIKCSLNSPQLLLHLFHFWNTYFHLCTIKLRHTFVLFRKRNFSNVWFSDPCQVCVLDCESGRNLKQILRRILILVLHDWKQGIFHIVIEILKWPSKL